MTNKKMTKQECFETVITAFPTEHPNYEDVIAIIQHEIENLEKRKTIDRKPTAKQVENMDVKKKIYEEMESEKKYTISDMQEEISVCKGASNQYISSLLRQMILENKIERSVEKRKTYFKKIEG